MPTSTSHVHSIASSHCTPSTQRLIEIGASNQQPLRGAMHHGNALRFQEAIEAAETTWAIEAEIDARLLAGEPGTARLIEQTAYVRALQTRLRLATLVLRDLVDDAAHD
jgi:hypothetical protein